ncbi:MAG: serine/threonine protein kinase, partial [Acidimicrobiales bacterium]
MAVRPKGNLYIGDTGLDQILERLASGSFQVIAGDGRQGFSGDGGSAADAELNSIGDMTFARNGVLYFADGNRIRAISPAGLISTVVGDGSSSRDVANGTPALQASVGYPSGLTIGP